ncbi:Ankyrin repeat domain-containing protein 17 [Durusdinium trenchii]|uniref:Ankyrin repeat domain-containing protein 17 n=1 Tax=Durusdinium trenchii TaxID=1381693 RepID=A0ABP0LN62_9DINO
MARTVRRSSGLVAISVIAVFLQAADARRATLGDKLEGVYELPPEEEEPEAPEKPPMPERRVPYSMHIVTQLPQHKHLKEESNAQHYIEEKVVGALENFEDFIRHVEVHLQKSDNFHREKRPEKAKAKSSADVVDEEEDVIPSPPEKEWGHKVLMPYVFKATVTLVNHHKIALSNPEKHAQASLQEATDHMVDVLRKSLREEKNRMISNKRKQAESMPDDMDDMEAYNKELSDAVVEAKASEDDEAEEALYQRIEAGVGPDGWAVISGKKPEMCVFGEEEWGEGQNRELVRKVKPETVTRFLRFIRVLGPLDTWLLFLKALCNPQNDGAISDKQQLVLSKIAFAGTAWRLLLKLVIEVQAFIMNEGWAIRFGGLDPCDQEPDQDDQGSSSSTSDLVDALLQVSKIMNSTGWPGTDSRRVGGMLSQLLTLTRLKQYPRGGVCSFGIFGQAARLAPLQDDAGEGLHLDFQSP